MRRLKIVLSVVACVRVVKITRKCVLRIVQHFFLSRNGRLGVTGMLNCVYFYVCLYMCMRVYVYSVKSIVRWRNVEWYVCSVTWYRRRQHVKRCVSERSSKTWCVLNRFTPIILFVSGQRQAL